MTGTFLARPWRTRVLVFGTTEGPNSLPQVVRDLAAMRAVLTDDKTGIAYDRDVTVLDEPTEARVLAAVRRRPGTLPDDLFVCYFSGHGSRDLHDQSLRLCMADSHRRPRDPASFGMRYDRLARALAATKAKHVLVILDCCYSGQAHEDVEPDERFCVLASVQANRRTPQDRSSELSPYTDALITALQPPYDRPVTAAMLSERLHAAFANRLLPLGAGRVLNPDEDDRLSPRDRTARAWKPRVSYTGGTIVISRPSGWPKPPRAMFARLRRKIRRHRWIAGAIAMVCAAAVGIPLGFILCKDTGPAAACPPPLELRVLASTENESAIEAAAESFERSNPAKTPLNRDDAEPDGCRRVNITVYAAQTNQVAEAFAQAARWPYGAAQNDTNTGRACEPAPEPDILINACAVPLRDVGPQPDIWIPDSTTELARVRQSTPTGTVTFDDPESIASTSLVLGVPTNTARSLAAASIAPDETSWRRLVDAVAATDQAPRLLRPNPAMSGTGLAHTLGLYLGFDGTVDAGVTLPPERARALEAQFSAPGSSFGDSVELLCGLSRQPADGEGVLLRNSAVLVSHKVLKEFNAGSLDRSGCAPRVPPPDEALSVYHPVGVPDLDIPFVPVIWAGTNAGDKDNDDPIERTTAVERFRTWLLAASDGGKALTDAGFDPPATDGTVAAGDLARIDAALAAYQAARTPGRVQFLLDVSGSMADDGKLSKAVAAIKQSLGVLGPRDSYGIDTFPGPAGAGDRTQVLVPMGTTDPAVGIRALGTLGPQPRGAALYEAIVQGIDRLAKDDREQPQLLVVITDGDRREPDDPGARRAEYAMTLAAPGKVPVVVLSLPGAECDPAVPSPLVMLTKFSAGRCLNEPADAGRQLAGMVAAVGAGTTG